MLVIVTSIPNKAMLIPYEHHDALKAITPNARPSLLFLFHAPFGIHNRIFLLQLSCQRVIRSCGSTRPAHGTVALEVVRWIVVRIEVFEVHVPAGGFDAVRVGGVGPLCHAGRA